MSAPLYYMAGDFADYRHIFIEQPYHIFRYKAGDTIFEPHTTWDCVMYINSGSVNLSIVQGDREKLLAIYGEGYIIPYYIPDEIEVTHLLQYKAVTDVTVIKVKKEVFNKTLPLNPALFNALYTSAWRLLHLLTHEVESQTFDSGLEKVATFLYTYFENTGHVKFEFTIKELQSFVGLNRTNLSKYLAFLVREHVIEKERGFIKITAPEKLRNYCSLRVLDCDLVPSTMIAHTSVSDTHKWNAIALHDASYDGVFWYGNKRSKTYCTPSCTSTTPQLADVVFFDTPQEAESSGYIPCSQCHADVFSYNPNREFLQEVKGFFDDHFDDPEALKTYFDALAMNSKYAAHLFKLQYDVTPHAYIREKQLEKVTTLLSDTDETILDIAMASGFHSMSGFYKTFKNHYACTPAQYRKSEQG